LNPKALRALFFFDMREAFDSVTWVVYFWFYFAFQFFVYGALMADLVVTVNGYFFYYGAGLIVLLSFNVASWAGRRFVESAHEGRLRYLLSLPIGRGELFVSQLLLGVVVNLTRMIPPLLLVLWLSGLFTPITLVESVLVLSAVATGIIGLMVSLSVVAFKSFDIYSAIVAALSALLIRFSTISYPISSMTSSYAAVSELNPLTYGSDLFRKALGFNTSLLLDPYLAAAVVVALCVGTLFAGMFFISHVVEGVKSS
jgi:ABC-type polysaccharide/polyol phosphate export permease